MNSELSGKRNLTHPVVFVPALASGICSDVYAIKSPLLPVPWLVFLHE
jgi:hypothetical protein